MEYEISDVIRDHIDEVNVTSHQLKVLTHIMECQTPMLGGHIVKCTNPNCDHVDILFNPCRDRHCPKCLGLRQMKWKLKRTENLLPVGYSHSVFKVPRMYYDLFRYNPKLCLNLMFQCASKAINCQQKDEKIGFIAEIHTHTQKLDYHPHIHCYIPEIKIENKGKLKVRRYVLDKEKLNISYKNILNRKIIKLIDKGLIQTDLKKEDITKSLKNSINYVYLKSSLKDPTKAINYLGNNTSKGCISNKNIKDYDGNNVYYNYVDRVDGNKIKTMKIDSKLFLERFILHILPPRLTKIRYYGYMSNNNKKLYSEIMKYIEEQVGDRSIKYLIETILKTLEEIIKKIEDKICPKCKVGHMELDCSIPLRRSP